MIQHDYSDEKSNFPKFQLSVNKNASSEPLGLRVSDFLPASDKVIICASTNIPEIDIWLLIVGIERKYKAYPKSKYFHKKHNVQLRKAQKSCRYFDFD